MQKKLRKEQFTLQDFIDQMQRVKKMGSFKSLLGMIPGLGGMLREMPEIDDDALQADGGDDPLDDSRPSATSPN